MCARSVEQKLIPVLSVDQQPIRGDMTLPVSGVVPAQIVIYVFRRQYVGDSQRVNDLLQKSHIYSDVDSLFADGYTVGEVEDLIYFRREI